MQSMVSKVSFSDKHGLDKSILDTPVLAQLIDTRVKERLIQTIFGRHDFNNIAEDDLNSYCAYFSYYQRQCVEALAGQGAYRPCRSHQDIVDMVSLLNSSQNKEDIYQVCRAAQRRHNQSTPGEVLTRTIELTARILFMHETNRWDATFQARPEWTATDSIQECLIKFYSSPSLSDKVDFERSFDARALENLAGFKIIWTDNLAEHLSLNDYEDRQTVRIFHHATYLKAMTADRQRILFPKDLLPETLRTLALLFPHKDHSTRRWFHQKSVKEEYLLDRGVLSCGRMTHEQRQIENFYYWRDRLIILKQAFDAAEPSTISQWWNDRRRRVQWATFWVAALVLLLTVVFGLIQSIEGALQVYVAYHPSQK